MVLSLGLATWCGPALVSNVPGSKQVSGVLQVLQVQPAEWDGEIGSRLAGAGG